MSSSGKPTSQKYRQLLIVLVVVFVLSPFLRTGVGSLLPTLLLLYAILLIVKSYSLPRSLVSIYSAIALVAFGIEVGSRLGWATSFNQPFEIFAQAIFALYLGAAAYWIGRDIWTTSEATADTVRGGISVYMLIGFVWALLYGIVATLEPGAFSPPLFESGSSQDSYLKALHFSFTTLTTLGYGDIVPVSDIALVLTNMEAIIGQMYVTIFIATLVGGYLSKHPNRRL